MSDKAKEAAAVYKTTANGSVLLGYHAVDPQGHLVMVPTLPTDAGWRYATDADHAVAEDAEAVRGLGEKPVSGGPIAQ